MTTVLSVASECVPFVKTGGLADVVGALPGALARHGIEMRVLLPGYRAVMAALGPATEVMSDDALFGGPARVLSAEAAGLHVLVLDAPHLFDRPGALYSAPDGRDWPDNPERFAALSWIAARIAAEGIPGWTPQILHGHDWQAALAPYYLAKRGGGAASVLTVHNIAFHGIAPAARLDALRLEPEDFTAEGGFEFYGGINALKAGLLWADRITTVSPSYARELTRPEFGAGLDGVIRARATQLSGILNGIDTDLWDPAIDPAIAKTYKTPRGKARNTAALRAEFDLPEAEGPLCVVVSRLTEQKGLDLLLDAVPTLLEQGGQLLVLGTGDPALEARLRALKEATPHVATFIGYDEALSHRVIAGGDAILVPSRFEPCGLTQLYGLRYGTIPLVALTGGLADTVINANPAALSMRVATGLQVAPLTADALRLALVDLCALFRNRPVWSRMQRNAMAQPVGWTTSAEAYRLMYDTLIETP